MEKAMKNALLSACLFLATVNLYAQEPLIRPEEGRTLLERVSPLRRAA